MNTCTVRWSDLQLCQCINAICNSKSQRAYRFTAQFKLLWKWGTTYRADPHARICNNFSVLRKSSGDSPRFSWASIESVGRGTFQKLSCHWIASSSCRHLYHESYSLPRHLFHSLLISSLHAPAPCSCSSYVSSKGVQRNDQPSMKKKVTALYPRLDPLRYKQEKHTCKVIYSVLVTLILAVLWYSKEMIPPVVTYRAVEYAKKEGYLESTPLLTKVKGGRVFRIPATWNRYRTPWFYPPITYLKTPQQSNYRYLYSPTRIMTSDGIGHSMGVVNYEYNMAIRLNLTYSHRVGFYSSLSARDRLAVEDFFGWGFKEVQRKTLQKEGCVPRNETWPADDNLYDCHFCGKPLRSGRMNIRHVVTLPSTLGRSSCHSASCRDMEFSFFRKHHHSHTIFQLNGASCQPPVTDSNMLETKNMFYHKYWNRHGKLLWLNDAKSSRSEKNIRFDPACLNVAMHVRRGDFLQEETRKKRTVTTDIVFVQVLRTALLAVRRRRDLFSSMPVSLHIYSEGKLLRNKVFSTHDVDVQDKAYYDSDGNRRDETWWKQLIVRSFKTGKDKTLQTMAKGMQIYLHISENTLDSLHEMIAADIFIGSASGMSVNLVWSISRGVVLIPHHGSIDNERGKKGDICCSVPFENNSGHFRLDLFEAYWSAYVAANGATAERSWLLAHRKTTAHV